MSDITPEDLTTREDFLAFVETLRRDLAANGDEVANVTVDDFLEALGAWTKDSDLDGPLDSWRLAAKLLRAGLFYE